MQAQGCLIVLATHDLEVAEHILSRSLFLRGGRLVSDLEADCQALWKLLAYLRRFGAA